MYPFFFKLLVLIGLYFLYKYSFSTESATTDMSNKDAKQDDKSNYDPENLIINMGGKQVPFSEINKPHNVVLEPKQHKPVVSADAFPDIEPEAKQREEELAAKRNILDPNIHKEQVNPDTFPDVEPEAKLREEQLEAERKKND
ncbi:uncharacterized protein SPAPADRAFT_60554 [Spathaspora passalidarum NRRL Y-27907]|uniref:Uncharacterized protein n=1 Tax=Spathaspora passalidarum (strain NRRL Y-27907 / 11-Y1) TaxID=619300 RepID=G3ALH2_SPAPN|nr:uncharacterized protein SPAPADRAFT_60554 [Spathaspora passalidarum NRRL Y-27907]EGW33215.1 hypothetical protein SPAPADRAFT_60554 [Spathaspora passalidarum NRRL Y-27907]